MQRASLAELLNLLDRPFVPWAVSVDTVDPDIGIDQGSSAAVVVCEVSAGHDVQRLERSLHRGGMP